MTLSYLSPYLEARIMDDEGNHINGIFDFEVLKLFKFLLSNKKGQFVVGYIVHHNTLSTTPSPVLCFDSSIDKKWLIRSLHFTDFVAVNVEKTEVQRGRNGTFWSGLRARPPLPRQIEAVTSTTRPSTLLEIRTLQVNSLG